MTYDLTFGKREYNEEREGESVQRLTRPDAPNFPGAFISAHQSEVSVGIGGGRDFFALDFPDAWKGAAPAVVALNPGDLATLDRAISKFQRRHRCAVPSFDATSVDAQLARLLVMRWWAAYALETFGNLAAVLIS